MMGDIRKLAEKFTELRALNSKISMDNSSQKKVRFILDNRDDRLLAVKAINEFNNITKENADLRQELEELKKRIKQ
jgi:hypothetical protein